MARRRKSQQIELFGIDINRELEKITESAAFLAGWDANRADSQFSDMFRRISGGVNVTLVRARSQRILGKAGPVPLRGVRPSQPIDKPPTIEIAGAEKFEQYAMNLLQAARIGRGLKPLAQGAANRYWRSAGINVTAAAQRKVIETLVHEAAHLSAGYLPRGQGRRRGAAHDDTFYSRIGAILEEVYGFDAPRVLRQDMSARGYALDAVLTGAWLTQNPRLLTQQDLARVSPPPTRPPQTLGQLVTAAITPRPTPPPAPRPAPRPTPRPTPPPPAPATSIWGSAPKWKDLRGKGGGLWVLVEVPLETVLPRGWYRAGRGKRAGMVWTKTAGDPQTLVNALIGGST